MSSSSEQVLFFQHLKTQLPPHISMVDEVADLLGISIDSAYRRIRGEKPIDLEEISKLCRHFKISMDQLLHLQSDNFIFTGNINDYADDNFVKWLEDVTQQLQMVNSFSHRHIYFLIKDIPPFAHFQIPELAVFKYFLWMKSILYKDEFKQVKFSIDDPRYAAFHTAGKKIIELYDRVATTEIWNIESINSTLRQIEFHREAGSFANKKDVGLLFSKVEELINHIERQAELGVKFMIGAEPSPDSPVYRMFINELILGDNTFMAEMDNMRVTFLNHSVLYFVGTRHEGFNKSMYNNLQNLMQKSTLISGVGEKERVRFFNRLRGKIHARQAALK